MKFLASPYLRYFLLAALVVLLWCTYSLGFHSTAIEALPSSWRALATPGHNNGPTVELLPDQILTSDSEAEEYCSFYRFKPFDSERRPKRKIFDLLLINTELEMLELRMGQMSPYVDFFVILESDKTFTDQPKPLHVRENWDRFKPWHAKMILRTMDLSALSSKDKGTWDREHESRNAMFSQVVPGLRGAQEASQDDVLLVSDADEIPKPGALKALRNCAFPPRTTLRSHMYYYSFQWLARNEDWGHPQATVYRGADGTVMPEDLRMNARDHDIRHAAWHCSWCFSSIHEAVRKVTSFSHTELDKPEFKDPERILQRVRSGKDFFDRSTSLYDRIENNRDVPEYLVKNAERFKFMLNRDPPNGNFDDYVPAGTQS